MNTNKLSRSKRRRLRKVKKELSSTASDIAQRINKYSPTYLQKLLLCGFIRELNLSVPCDIESLCSSYLPLIIDCKCNDLTKYINNTIIKFPTSINIKFNQSLKNIYTYQQRMIMHHISTNRKLRFHLIMQKSSATWLSVKTQSIFDEQMEHLEYILFKNSSSIKTINLSHIDLNDHNLWILCRIFKNISNYYQQKNVKAQFDVHIIKTKNNFKFALDTLNLSSNQLTDKCVDLLLETIKKYLPDLRVLDLSFNNLSNQVIPEFIKYYRHHDGFSTVVYLNNCRVTSDVLNKYKICKQYEKKDRGTYFVHWKDIIKIHI